MAGSGLLFLLFCTSTVLAVGRFDGHRVLKVIPKSQEEFDKVVKIQDEAAKDLIDIWKLCSGVGKPFMFRVPPGNYKSMVTLLQAQQLHYVVTIDDVQQAAERQRSGASGNTLNAIDFDYGRYHDFDEVNQWIDDMAAEYPENIEIFTASKTFEDRTVRGLKISTGGNGTRPGMWYQGGIHAREWISPATVMYITGELMDKYSVRADVKEVLDGYDLYVVPVLNADGYSFTWSENRMWRKTRTSHGLCKGVDPNRNYDYQWGESSGSSSDPCSDTFRGPAPFSEPVIKGVTDFIINSGVTFKGYIDFHSFSEVWMTAWGYTSSLPTDFTQQDASSEAATEAIKAVYGTEYEHGTIANVLYIANGNSVDWAYGARGIKYACTPELRDKGQFGFLLPADQIIPCGEETLEGFLAYAKYVLDN